MYDIDNNLQEFLEGERKKIVSPCIIAIVMFITGAFLLLMQIATASSPTLAILGFIIILVALLYYFIAVNPQMREYKFLYKEHVVKGTFSKVIDNLVYEPSHGISEHLIESTGLMQTGNRYKTEDYMSGSYKDVKFTRADVVIEDHRSNGKSSYTVTYFKGRWMIFNFNKNFRSDLQIIERGFEYSKQKSTIFTNKTQRRHVFETENVEFNRKFKCLCQNDAEAFYILTPHMIEAILDLGRKTDGDLMLGFVNNALHVAINNNKDAFEPHIFSPFSFEEDILPVIQEMNGITDFVNELNLDRNIFKQ